MYFVFSLIPATLFVVLGYFILFSSTKAEGTARTLGQVLAIWVFVMAATFPMAGTYAMYAGLPSIGATMRSMHSGGSS